MCPHKDIQTTFYTVKMFKDGKWQSYCVLTNKQWAIEIKLRLERTYDEVKIEEADSVIKKKGFWRL